MTPSRPDSQRGSQAPCGLERRAPDDDACPYCGEGDHVPAKGYWRCPVCDAEWNDDEDGEP